MAQKDVTVTFKADAKNAIGLIKKEKFIKAFNGLEADDQRRIAEIMENKKALQGLAENWDLLQGMFQ